MTDVDDDACPHDPDGQHHVGCGCDYDSPDDPPRTAVRTVGEFHGLTLDDWAKLVQLAAAVKVLDRPVSVLRAVALVMADMPGIQKLTPAERRARLGQAADPGERGVTYAYRGIDQVTSEAQHLFGRHGVVLTWETLGYTVTPFTQGQNNAPWTEHELRVKWTVHGPLGDTLTIDTIGLGRDNSDKGSNKALTGAYKNLLLKLLTIGDPKDDPDAERVDNEPGQRMGNAPSSRDDGPPPEPVEATEENTPGIGQARVVYDLLPRLNEAQKTAVAAVREHWGKSLTVRDLVKQPAYRAHVIAAINQHADGDAPTVFVAPGDVSGADPTPPPSEPSAAEQHAVGAGDAVEPSGPMTDTQNRRIRALYRDLKIKNEAHLASTKYLLGLDDLDSHRTLTQQQAEQLISGLDLIRRGDADVIAYGESGAIAGIHINQPAAHATEEPDPAPVDEPAGELEHTEPTTTDEGTTTDD